MKEFQINTVFIVALMFTVVACSEGNGNNKSKANEEDYQLNSFDDTSKSNSVSSSINKKELKEAFNEYNKNDTTQIQPVKINNSNAMKDYDQARSVFWKKLYNQGGETLYCGVKFDGSYNSGINIEHIFPMSWVTKSLNCGERKECRRYSKEFNLIEGDLHNLYPSRTDINEKRSSIAFGMVKGEERNFGRCDFEIGYNPTLVEPRDSVRGEIARTMFYMVDRHKQLKLFDKQIGILKQWNNADQVSKVEKWRNDQIESLQGNRNPFIDNPDLINQNF